MKENGFETMQNRNKNDISSKTSVDDGADEYYHH